MSSKSKGSQSNQNLFKGSMIGGTALLHSVYFKIIENEIRVEQKPGNLEHGRMDPGIAPPKKSFNQLHIDCRESVQWVRCLTMDAMDSASGCKQQKV
jgi:hypothetical protein